MTKAKPAPSRYFRLHDEEAMIGAFWELVNDDLVWYVLRNGRQEKYNGYGERSAIKEVDEAVSRGVFVEITREEAEERINRCKI